MVTTENPPPSPFLKGGSALRETRRLPGNEPVQHALHVAGLTRLSTTDYPGHLAAVVFVQGCAWRCKYCHNPEIQSRLGAPAISWAGVLDFLDHRLGLLDGVVFCGGEPTVDRHLGTAIDDVRERGFKVGLHTAGIYPDRLRRLLPTIDWVGFDVKAPFENYAGTTGVQTSGERARESLKYLLASGVAHEIRTTRHPDLLSADDLRSMATALRKQGVERFALQEFRPHGCADATLDACPPPLGDDDVGHLQRLFPTFILRRAG